MEVNGTQGVAKLAAAGNTLSRAPAQDTRRNESDVETAETTLQGNEQEAIAAVAVQQEFPPNTRLFLDEESNRIVAQVLDENNEVVRQLPPQELLDISARFNRLEGILFDEQG
jgi:uncharacterized FlaG/YvyC family protein